MIKVTNGELLNVQNFFIDVENGSKKSLLYKMIYVRNAEDMKDDIQEVHTAFERLQEENKGVIDGYNRYKAAVQYVLSQKDNKELVNAEIEMINAEYAKEIDAHKKFVDELMNPFMQESKEIWIDAIHIGDVPYSELMNDTEIPLFILKLFINTDNI